MSDLDTRLTAALHADAPPARDARFRVEALVRLEQARFRRRVATIALVAAGVAVIAAVSAPTLDMWIGDVQRLWIVAIGGPVALFVLLVALLGRRTGVGTVLRAVDRWLYS